MRGKSIALSIFLASGLIGTSGTVFGQAAGGTIRSNQEHSQPALTDEHKAAVNNAPVSPGSPAAGVVPRATAPVQPRVVQPVRPGAGTVAPMNAPPQPVRRYAWQYVWPGYWFWLPVAPTTSAQPAAPGARVQPAPVSPAPVPAPARAPR